LGIIKSILTNRNYILQIHNPIKPVTVTVNGKVITDWAFNSLDKKGITTMSMRAMEYKLKSLYKNKELKIKINKESLSK
jgi:hypothetical protein